MHENTHTQKVQLKVFEIFIITPRHDATKIMLIKAMKF